MKQNNNITSSASKTLMKKANVPVVPGYHGTDQSLANLTAEAEKIGYPVIIKAWHGGGGKGMKIVERKEDLEVHEMNRFIINLMVFFFFSFHQ